jgi:hypothetical protein
MRTAYLIIAALLLQAQLTYAWPVSMIGQNKPDSTGSSLQQLPGKYFSQVSGKSRHFEKQMNKRSEKALERLARQERKMQARLARIDAIAAENIFSRSIDPLN